MNDRCAQVWLAISGIAYDVTEFLAEHPGGEEVVMEVTGAGCCSRSPARLRRASRLPLATGKDATADFDDVGHSDEARGMMDGSNDTIKIVGTIEGEIPEHMQQQESEDVRTAVSLCRPVPGLPRLSAHPPVCAHPSCELTPDAGMLVCCVLRTRALLGRTR